MKRLVDEQKQTHRVFNDIEGLIDEHCLEISFNVPELQQERYSLEYNQRIHLMRTHLAFLTIGLITYLAAFISGIAVCCSRASKWALLSTVFTYTTAFCVSLAMASFHGVEYLERNRIDDTIGNIIFRKQWPRVSKQREAYIHTYMMLMVVSRGPMVLHSFAEQPAEMICL
ncbi:uncharacterized protein LOC106869762 [Octopus bimaculoides]|nr:uncharacterized protein LOC106869762 [Octopus bimaculoides]